MRNLELPALRVGMAGFSADEERRIERAAAKSRTVRWQCGPFAGADVWLLNSARAQWLGEGRVRIAPGRVTERAVQVQVDQFDRPVALTEPLPPNAGALCTFDPRNADSLLDVLRIFELSLAPLRAQHALAQHIAEHQEMLSGGVFELRSGGRLIASVDMRADVALLGVYRRGRFDAGIWQQVEQQQVDESQPWSRTTLSSLMWRYVSRSERDLLPERYGHKTIFFRRPPRISPLLLDTEHLLVMRQLSVRPATLTELATDLDLPAAMLRHVLAALYFAGSVTVDPRRANYGTMQGEFWSRAADGAQLSGYAAHAQPGRPGDARSIADVTAPLAMDCP